MWPPENIQKFLVFQGSLHLNFLPPADYLCTPEENVYKIDFTRFKIRDMESGTVLFEITKPAASGECTHKIRFPGGNPFFCISPLLLLHVFPKSSTISPLQEGWSPILQQECFSGVSLYHRVSRAGCCCAFPVAICDGKGQMDVVNRSRGGGGDHWVVFSWLFITLCPLHIV